MKKHVRIGVAMSAFLATMSTVGFAEYFSTSFESSEGYTSGSTLVGQEDWVKLSGYSDTFAMVSASGASEGSQAAAFKTWGSPNNNIVVYHDITTTDDSATEPFTASADLTMGSTATRFEFMLFNPSNAYCGIHVGMLVSDDTLQFFYQTNSGWTSQATNYLEAAVERGTTYTFTLDVTPVTYNYAQYDLSIYNSEGTLVDGVSDVYGGYQNTGEITAVGFRDVDASAQLDTYADNIQISASVPEPVTMALLCAGLPFMFARKRK